MMNVLRERNKKLLIQYQTDPENVKRHLLIKEILKNDNCFFQMSMETSYSILFDLKIPQQEINHVYSELIDITHY